MRALISGCAICVCRPNIWLILTLRMEELFACDAVIYRLLKLRKKIMAKMTTATTR